MTAKKKLSQTFGGFSLVELMAAVSILGVIATLALVTVSNVMDEGQKASCHVNRAEIEIQCQRWHRSQGSYPSSGLTTIGANVNYFPEGVPNCPVDGTTYTINNATGLVVGHDH